MADIDTMDVLTFILGLTIILPIQYLIITCSAWGRNIIEWHLATGRANVSEGQVIIGPTDDSADSAMPVAPRTKNKIISPPDEIPIVRALRLGIDLIEAISKSE